MRDLEIGRAYWFLLTADRFARREVKAVNQHGVTTVPEGLSEHKRGQDRYETFFGWDEIEGVSEGRPERAQNIGKNVAPHGPSYRGFGRRGGARR